MTIDNYLNRVTGTSAGRNHLQISIKKSFQSATFQLFWRNWNPLFGYYLARNVNRPYTKFINDKK